MKYIKTHLLTNTNALNILTLQVVIVSPKGAAISFLMGLLRPPHQVRGLRNDKLLIALVLISRWQHESLHLNYFMSGLSQNLRVTKKGNVEGEPFSARLCITILGIPSLASDDRWDRNRQLPP
jgi:hypothetical protein